MPIAFYVTAGGGGALATSLSLPLSPAWEVLLLSGWSAVWLAIAVTAWTDYYLDAWVITDRRIIDIEQRGFFSREVSSFRLDRIQDVTTDIRGVLATLLDFGDVHVQTAGESRTFILSGAPRPAGLKERILQMHHWAAGHNNTRGGLGT